MFLRFGLIRKALMTHPMERVIAEYPPSGKERRGSKAHLERVDKIARAVIYAYGATLEEPTLWRARFHREMTVAPLRGVSVEGLALGLSMASLTTPFSGRNHALEFADDLEGRQRGLVYVGIGMALGFLGLHPKRFWSDMRPEFREWVLDGYGFTHGFFKQKKFVEGRRIPRRLAGRDLMLFDEGLGRAIWIGSGADIPGVAARLQTFGERERALWGGVGLASTYAGVCDQAGYERLRLAAGRHFPALARGCAMACYQAALDQYIADHSELAAREIWDASVLEVAEKATRHLNGGLLASPEAPVAYAYQTLESDALRMGDPRSVVLPSVAEREMR